VGLGNRRFRVSFVVAAVFAVGLSGCSSLSADQTLGSTNGGAVAIGQQAIGFTSSGGTSAGWISPVSCPDSFEQGLRMTIPATYTVQKIDPKTVGGPASDPQLTKGYVATCAYSVNTGNTTLVALAFFDIDNGHASALKSKLASDGFTAGQTTSSSVGGHPFELTLYAGATSRIVVESMTIDTVPAFMIVG
jgi:hypothetical protein